MKILTLMFMLLFNYLDTLPKLYFASVTTVQVNHVLSYSSMNIMPIDAVYAICLRIVLILHFTVFVICFLLVLYFVGTFCQHVQT